MGQYCINNAQYVKAVTLGPGFALSATATVVISLENYSARRNHMATRLNDLDGRLSSHQEEQTAPYVKIAEAIGQIGREMHKMGKESAEGKLQTLLIHGSVGGRVTLPFSRKTKSRRALRMA